MDKFHSTTMSRRAFMKALGLVGVGVGASVASAPVFHDIEELTASPNAQLCHPWWVKEKDKPNVEIDWNLVKPWDWKYEPSNTVVANPGFGSYAPYGVNDAQVQSDLDRTHTWRKGVWDVQLNAMKTNEPEGWALRARALRQACNIGGKLASTDFTGYDAWGPGYWGLPAYNDGPENNSRTIRAALHFMGFLNVGFMEMDENIKKLFYPKSDVFADVDVAYRDSEKRQNIIPNKCKWVIVATVAKNTEITRGYGPPWETIRPSVYCNAKWMSLRAQLFVKELGWQALTRGMNVPLGVLAGNVELGRINQVIHPERGARITQQIIIVTDMPLETTKPIDAGIWDFCKSCKICAEHCRDLCCGAISMEKEPTYEVTGPWNRVGVKKYHLNWPACGYGKLPGIVPTPGPVSGLSCGLCTRVCPFNAKDIASAHKVVRAVASTTPIFNGFFAAAEEQFGYTKEADLADWWNRDLRTYKYDVVIDGDNLNVL